MKNTMLTNITKKVGNFIAQKTKDADNELFSEISEKVIEEFINEIKSDNPVLAAWVNDWVDKNKNNEPKPAAKKTIKRSICSIDDCYDSCSGGCYDHSYGRC